LENSILLFKVLEWSLQVKFVFKPLKKQFFRCDALNKLFPGCISTNKHANRWQKFCDCLLVKWRAVSEIQNRSTFGAGEPASTSFS